MRIPPTELLGAIGNITRAIESTMLQFSLKEPDLVGVLLRYIVNTFIQNPVPKLSVGAVFVHQRPMVHSIEFRSKKTNTVELGDLLIIRRERTGANFQNQKSILLQAKKTVRLPTNPGDPDQHHLYESWPEVSYRRFGVLNHQLRKNEGTHAHAGAKYLLFVEKPSTIGIPIFEMHRHHSNRPHIYTADATKPLNCYRDFTLELVEFICGNAGRAYAVPAGLGAIGWDKIMEDLLGAAANLVSLHMDPSPLAAVRSKQSRGLGAGNDAPIVGDVSDLYKQRSTDGNDSVRPPINIDTDAIAPVPSGVPILIFNLDGGASDE